MNRFGFFRIIALLAVGAGLSACASDEPVLTGRKVSVLTYGRELMPDADLKKTYLLPEPETVPAWTQAGGVSHHVMQNPALAPKIMQAWKISIGQGSSKKVFCWPNRSDKKG